MAQDVQLFDTHCHIHEIAAADPEGTHTEQLWHASGLSLDEVIERGAEAGVMDYMLVGCTVRDSELAVDLAPDLKGAHVSIGVHPHEAAATLAEPMLLERFTELAATPRVQAIGECGLDYFYQHSPREAQIELLHFQLKLAQQHALPVIFHVREAYDEFWPIFDQYDGVRGVLHSYTDTPENLAEAIKRDLYIGVNGIATFAKQPSQQAMFASIPLERMVLETDAPYLTPVPHRGKINQLQHVRDVAEFVARTRGLSLEEVASQTTANARALFTL